MSAAGEWDAVRTQGVVVYWHRSLSETRHLAVRKRGPGRYDWGLYDKGGRGKPRELRGGSAGSLKAAQIRADHAVGSNGPKP